MRTGRPGGDGRTVTANEEAQAPHGHPDLPRDPGGGLLLRGQDRLRPALGGGGQALLPFAPPAVRQEPAAGHGEGAVRGQRGAVPRLARALALGLDGAPSGAATGLQRKLRRVRRVGGVARQPGAATRRDRGGRGADRGPTLRRRRGPVPPTPAGAAPGDRAAGRGAGGRIRQAHAGRDGRAGRSARQPRLPARGLFGHQVLRRGRAVQPVHRGHPFLQGEPVLRPQPPDGPHPGAGVLGHLRLYGRGLGIRVRAGTAGPGPASHPGLVQRLRMAGPREGLQPLRHPVAVRQAALRRALVRDRHAVVPDPHTAGQPRCAAGPRRPSRVRRPAGRFRRGGHGRGGPAVPDRLPDGAGHGGPGRGGALPAGLSQPRGAAGPQPKAVARHGAGHRRPGGEPGAATGPAPAAEPGTAA